MNAPRPPIEQVLFIALSGIGNLLMQLPTIETFKRHYPTAHITVWVAPRGTRVLADNHSMIDHVIESPIKQSIGQHWQLIRQLRRNHFDLAIMLSPGQLWKGSTYMWLAGIPQRIAHMYPLRNNKQSSFLLTDAIPEDVKLHDIEQNLRLLEPLGIKNLDFAPRLRRAKQESEIKQYHLTPSEINKRHAEQLIKQLQIPINKPLIGLHPGSAPDMIFKRWPLDRWQTLATKLINEHSAHILLFGGPAEQEQIQTLKENIGNDVTTISTDLLTAAALMQHCKIFIANDSGLMHVAAAVGTPTWGIFGPTSEFHTGPRGPHSHVIRAAGTQPTYNTEKNFHLGSKAHPSLLALSVNDVLRQLQSALPASL